MEESKETILEGLDNLIKGKLFSDKKIPQESWKSAILTKAEKNISKLKARVKPFQSNPILKQVDVIICLEALQKKIFFYCSYW